MGMGEGGANRQAKGAGVSAGRRKGQASGKTEKDRQAMQWTNDVVRAEKAKQDSNMLRFLHYVCCFQ